MILTVLSDTVITILETDSGDRGIDTAVCVSASISQPLERNVAFNFRQNNHTNATLYDDFDVNFELLIIYYGYVGEFYRCFDIHVSGDDVVEGDKVAIYEVVPLNPVDMVEFPSDNLEIVITIVDNDGMYVVINQSLLTNYSIIIDKTV